MNRAHRAPFVVVQAMAGALLTLHTYDAWMDRRWAEVFMSAAMVVACVAGAAVLSWWPRPGWPVPSWAHRFEVDGPLFRLMCNQCDAEVLPPAFTATLPRLLSYAHVHTTTACEKHREAAPGGDTARLGPPRYWRTRGRG